MNELIYDIFKIIGNERPEMEQADKIISKEVYHLLEPYKEKMTIQEWEKIKDLMFSICYCSKREAFAVGFYYGVELLLNKKL